MASYGMNKAILIGRVDGDPVFKVTPSGRSRLWMKLHTTETLPDERGLPRDRHAWLQVVVWGRRAQALSRFLRHGRRVAVEGRLVNWRREGTQPARWETQVHAHDIVLLEHVRDVPPRARPQRSDEPDRDAA